ncbi:TRAP transporter small permease [Azospirillum sp. ST 5-10]|uniref:TRAP transporter small permease n=1 Tax=unclassified Azospirillum TaxID=2630922 RepID=UPI003F49F2A8
MPTFFDRLERILNAVIATLTVLLVFVLFEQVVHRYVFGGSWPVTGFLIPLFFVWLSMVGSAIGVRRGVHFSADVIVPALPPELRLPFRLVQIALSGLVGILLVWTGIGFVGLGLVKSDPFTGFPMAATYAALPAGGLLMIVFALEIALRGGEPLLDETLRAES